MKKDIGDILLSTGTINTQQLAECRHAVQENGGSLEACILSKNFVTPQSIAQAYAKYASLEYIDAIGDKMADTTLMSKVPLKFLRDHAVIPIIFNDQVTIVTSNPLDFQPLDELNMLLGGIARYAITDRAIIIDAINRYYPLEGTKQMIEEFAQEDKQMQEVSFEQIEEKDILAMATEAPIIKLVNHILFQAVKRGASDIHIEPFEKDLRVRYRIDGVMLDVMTPPKRIQSALTSRIKIMAHMNIAEKRIPQDGRIAIKVGDKAIDIRVSVLPVAFGERIVMRLLDKTRSFVQLEDMGFSERDLKVVLDNIHRPNGIIYVTGPTGSGKTSTLYSILYSLNQPDVNIITVEDPVEYQMAGVGQVQVREKVGMTFAAALRSILRQDPDIIMIGETRDQETAQIAVQAALTGHLVLSTLHTNSAPASITRLIDMGVEPFLIASSVVLIIAQRLVRTLCKHCKQIYKPQEDLLARLGLTQAQAKKITFYQAKGCDECNGSGYRGRKPIFEIMEITDGISRLTMERADMGKIRAQAIQDGMTQLITDGIRRIAEGVTTIEEVLSVAAIEQTVVE